MLTIVNPAPFTPKITKGMRPGQKIAAVTYVKHANAVNKRKTKRNAHVKKHGKEKFFWAPGPNAEYGAVYVNPPATEEVHMAKRKRSAAQRAATRRMLAANRAKRNPSHRRHRTYRRAAVINPRHTSYRRRTRRNPSTRGSGLFGELMSKDGLFSIAAIVGTPTVTEMAVGYIMPTATGYTRTAIKAGIGLGVAYAVYRFANKRAGVITGMVAVGSAVAELIGGTQSVLPAQHGMGSLGNRISTLFSGRGPVRPNLGIRPPARPGIGMQGYGIRPMSGYSNLNREPGAHVA